MIMRLITMLSFFKVVMIVVRVRISVVNMFVVNCNLFECRMLRVKKLFNKHQFLDAVAFKQRLGPAKLLPTRDQIVLNAAARYRANDDAIIAHRHQRSRWSRACAKRLGDCHQPNVATGAHPLTCMFEHFEIKRLQCAAFPDYCTVETARLSELSAKIAAGEVFVRNLDLETGQWRFRPARWLRALR